METLEELKEQRQAFDKVAYEAIGCRMDLDIKIQKAICEELLKPNFLNQIEWVFRFDPEDEGIVLDAKSPIPEIFDNYQTKDTISYELTKDVSLTFNDNDLYLVFNNLKSFRPFIQKHILKVDYSKIDKAIEKTEQILREFKAIKQKVEVK